MTDTPPKITNVFVLMLENHSFDNIFAMSGIPGIRAANVSDFNVANGKNYHVRDGAPWSMPTDPGHEFEDVLEQLCGSVAAREYRGGAYPQVDNSGFASSYASSTTELTGLPDEHQIGDIMACYDTRTQLPVIRQLACEFAICDQWFSSLPGPTWPNRFFVHGASSADWSDSPEMKTEIPLYVFHGFQYENGSIFDSMRAKGIRYRIYNDFHNRFSDDPSGFEFGGWIAQVAALKGISLADIRSLDHLSSDLEKADYKDIAYTFIEPNYGKSFFAPQPAQKGIPAKDLAGPTYKGGSAQHPEDDPSGGEGLIKAVYEAIRRSPLWDTSLLLILYDEHGGFYDSVRPGTAVPPGDQPPPDQTVLNKSGFDFGHYGARVPAVVVSPLIPKGAVDPTKYDHASVLATLERLLGLQPLTRRDACANDVLHLLTEKKPRTDCPLILASPAPARRPAPRSAEAAQAESAKFADQPLAKTGNTVGFLYILLKSELELIPSEEGRIAAIEAFKRIDTQGKARDYVMAIAERIISLRNIPALD